MQLQAQWLTPDNKGQRITEPTTYAGVIINTEHRTTRIDETTYADMAAGRERIITIHQVEIEIERFPGGTEIVRIQPETLLTLEEA